MVATTQQNAVRPGYKHTEVGVIPEDWKVQQLRDVTTLMTNGFVGKATLHYTGAEDGVVYIQGFNVEENSFNLTGIRRVTRRFHNQHLRSCLREGDLLTIQTGEVGLTTIVSKELEGSNCHALVISRFNNRLYEPKYFSYYFNSSVGRSKFADIETGSTMKHLNVGDMLGVFVPHPPTKAEQSAIASALTDVDGLLASQDKLIAKKRDIKAAAMQQLLTGKQRLPGFSGKWDVKRLGDVGTCLRGVSYKGESDLSPYDTQSTKRLLRANNVQNGMVVTQDIQFVNAARVSAEQMMRSGDILICMACGSKALAGNAAALSLSDGFEYTFGAFMGRFR